VEQHLAQNGPWKYKLSETYYTHEVEVALNKLYLEAMQQVAA